ncbi:MAG: hypothetical protein ACKOYM_06180 [Actinomycetes bacterium]
MGDLVVDFCGEEFVLSPGQTLTFGRAADLTIDSANVHLHRVAGCFASDGQTWTLHNLGRYVPIRVVDLIGSAKVELGPGDQVPLGFESFAVHLTAATSRYELLCNLPGFQRPSLGLSAPSDTVQFARMSLNDEQRQLVLCLAEPLLRGEPDWMSRMPSNKDVAARLGWSLTKFNRKLDYLCRRMANQGVSGLQGHAGRLATVRRQRLVEVFVESGVVTLADLDQVMSADPRSSD